MTINTFANGNTLTISVEGRLDTVTAPELEQQVKSIPGDVQKLIFDFLKLEYISSAGLRVLLTAQKLMNRQGGDMAITGASEDIRDIFEITGFSGILTLE